ncbi:hypothetical protein ABW636_12095 [Aquimarina sp. 2201CG1-2-11]|uniref:hypothetical protein n=1 Tax=Aquimarina discodermiae TaxID=3231043 RepID=UPI0034626FC8
MNFKTIASMFGLTLLIISCKNTSKEKHIEENIDQKTTTVVFKNKGHELVHNMVEKVGNYNKLRIKKDVIYNYTYTTPDSKSDISTEKYIFDGELSYGIYRQHQRTLPELIGTMEQGYDGINYWLKIDEKEVLDEVAVNRVKFNRPTNFYWFTMFQKLLDPGLHYEYLGNKKIKNTDFEIVKISFETQKNKPTDIYQIYINKKTGLVDQFLFTVADFGVVDTPFLMQIEYEQIDNFLIPTKRKYKKSTWNADINDEPWILVNWTDIKFNNNLKKKDFIK